MSEMDFRSDKVPTQKIEVSADLYDVDETKLKHVFCEHQSYPHDVIGFQEYREMDATVLRDDSELFMIEMDVEEFDHEMSHLIEEQEVQDEHTPSMMKALDHLYFLMAQAETDEGLDNVGTRFIVFKKGGESDE